MFMRSQSVFFQISQNRGLDRRSGGIDWGYSQDRDKPFTHIVWPLSVGPCEAQVGLGMAAYLKHFNLAVPDRLALKLFMDRNGFEVNRSAPVQFLYGRLDSIEIFLSVQTDLQGISCLRLDLRYSAMRSRKASSHSDRERFLLPIA